jgi:uncharacterized membrane protein YhaH (DUF805 family)
VENRNPYASPRAKVADDPGESQEYGEIRIFSAQGRLGRVRYIGYSAGVSMLVAIIGFGLAALLLAAGQNTAAIVIGGVTYVALFVVQILLTIQRAHDFDTSGWLSVLFFVPLVSLIFWFIPGTKGENQYGYPPPPNTAGVIVLALIVPMVAIVGILAAIAIPAYQDYTIRAQVSEGLALAAEAKAAVAQAYLDNDVAPPHRLAAGLSADATDSGGTYVDGVDIADGTVLVKYGIEANTMIAGGTVAIQPYVMPDKSIVWRCGHAPAPGGAVAMAPDGVPAGAATSLQPRFLPSACRP